MDVYVFEIIAWIAASAVLVWAFVPATATALGWTRVEVDWIREDLKDGGSDPEWTQRVADLEALGFRRMGTILETAWLFYHYWKWKAPDQTLMVTPHSTCLAMLYRYSPRDGVRIAFETYLSDDGRVTTVLPGVGLQTLEGNKLRVEMPVMSAADLYARHAMHVQQFADQKRLRPIMVTPEQRCDYDWKDSLFELRKSKGWAAMALPTKAFAAPALFDWILLSFVSSTPPELHLPIAILLGGATYAWVLVNFQLPAMELARQDAWNPPAAE